MGCQKGVTGDNKDEEAKGREEKEQERKRTGSGLCFQHRLIGAGKEAVSCSETVACDPLI